MSRSSIWDQLSPRRPVHPETVDESADEVLPDSEPEAEAFQANEFSFVRPEGLLDKTYHVLSSGSVGPGELSIVISRAVTQKDASLEAMANRVLVELEKMPEFTQYEALSPYEIAGVDARRAKYSWRHQGRLLHVDQVLFLHQDEQGNPVLLQITATSSYPDGMTGKQMAQLEQIHTSFTLRQPGDNDDSVEVDNLGTAT